MQTIQWVTVRTAADVTPEILDLASDVLDGWFSHVDADHPHIDWDDFLGRMEEGNLPDGQRVDFPILTGSGVAKVRRHVRQLIGA